MKIFLPVLLVVCSLQSFAQVPQLSWERSIGGSQLDTAQKIISTADGGTIICGSSNSSDIDVSSNQGLTDVWIVKLNAAGEIQWQKNYGGSDFENATDIKPTLDGGYIVSGYTNSTNGDIIDPKGGCDGWILKLDSEGEMIWHKNYGGSGPEQFWSIVPTVDGGYTAAGYSRSIDGEVALNQGHEDVWIVKVDGDGIIEWEKTFGGTMVDYGYAIDQTADGGYIVACESNSQNGNITAPLGSWDFWILKLNALGTLTWQKSFGGASADSPSDLRKTSDGGFIIVGESKNFNNGVPGNHTSSDMWALKINASGILQWQKAYGGSKFETAKQVELTSDGGFFIFGTTASFDGPVVGANVYSDGINHNDPWLIKVNALGDIQWQKIIGGMGCDVANSFCLRPNGDILTASLINYISGDVTTHNGGGDVWLANITTQALAINQARAQAFAVYPNPSDGKVRFSLPDSAIIEKVTLTDISGRRIQLTNLTAAEFDVAQVASGIYTIEITTNEGNFVSKLIRK